VHSYIIESFLLGLSVGPVCVAYCSPVLVPLLSSSSGSNLPAHSFNILKFLSGRFIGYLLVGVIVGVVGGNVHRYIQGTIFGVMSILLGVSLLYFGLQRNFPEWKFCRAIRHGNSGNMFFVLMGFLTGLNLCPPFIAAIAGAIQTGTMGGSIIYFSAFFLGTVIFFPGMILFGWLSKIDVVRSVASVCMVISGAWFFFRGIGSFF
jgi:sulfite exporter TauE/SafE